MNALRGALLVGWLAAAPALAYERPSLATVAVSEDHAIEGGIWRSLLKRTAVPFACGTRKLETTCVEHALVVDNQSPQPLECFASLGYRPEQGVESRDPEVPALVMARSSREILGRITEAGTKAELVYLTCRPHPAYKRLKVDAECKYEMFGTPFETYYPAAAVQLALEGPVVVAFTLPRKSGPAADVSVADTSLIPSLDAAAVRFIKDQRFTTGCPGTRFDLRMRFELRNRLLALPKD